MSRETPSLTDFRRLVIKVGSSLLVDSAAGRVHEEWLASLAEDIAQLHKEKRDILVVSSGAIALGRAILKLPKGSLKLEDSQAAAAVGQIALARAWSEALGAHSLTAGQVLVTLGDTEERRRYLNARATLKTLIALGSIAVINENDTVATAEIRYGDNDRLAARVASMMEADLLILLSDVDGLYTSDPARDAAAAHVAEVDAITPQVEAMAGDTLSGVGRGGMASKLAAAKIATAAGCDVIIAKGSSEHPIAAIRSGARTSRFAANGTPAAARKRWIAGVLKPQGTLIIDAGAAKALADGKSLLPAGIRQIDGRFERGDAVVVKDHSGREIARGLAAYGAGDAERIAGKRSLEIEAILGYRGRDEMIHRDDLALTGVVS
jgi:glutamate 5-kinase